MTTLTLTVQTNGAAFDDGTNGAVETARILRKLADRLEADGLDAATFLHDINGNRCGLVDVTEADTVAVPLSELDGLTLADAIDCYRGPKIEGRDWFRVAVADRLRPSELDELRSRIVGRVASL